MTNETPAKEGFRSGYLAAVTSRQSLPPNPYPLRTEDRTAWSKGYVAGIRLGRKHHAALEAALAAMPPHTDAIMTEA